MHRKIAAVLCAFAGFVLAGCAASGKPAPRPASPDPTVDELPHIPELQRNIPARIGVAGLGNAPRAVLVAPMPPVEPTAEEKKILGDTEPPPLQELTLNRPPPGPQQGVYPRYGGIIAGSQSSKGGPHSSLGAIRWTSGLQTAGSGGGSFAQGGSRVTSIGSVSSRDRSRADSGRREEIRTGEGRASHIADHHRTDTP
ncbi:MAG: hypothetical protein U1D55_07795 [Phycisphaerae bacterium]